MTASIYPDTTGDRILRFMADGSGNPALFVVDTNGDPTGAFPKLADIRDGGGHLEFFRQTIDEGPGFDRDGQLLKIHE